VADFQAEAEAFPPGTALLLTLTFISFALEGLVPGYRYRFWLYGRQALGGEWWQLLTALFLHTDLVQLGFNMAALWGFGPPLEAAIGTSRFVVLYLTSGAVGNALSVMMNPYIQTVGASGCLFGVGGAWIGLQLRERRFSTRVVALLLAYIVGALAIGFTADSGLNNWAHLGGFLWGFILALTTATNPSSNPPEGNAVS
jgi:rhomboid protease GluP